MSLIFAVSIYILEYFLDDKMRAELQEKEQFELILIAQ